MSLYPTVVLGMHRSGTSAVTACLSALGLAAPHGHEQIIAPDNPAHLEPRRIVLHNDALLATTNARWDNPPAQSPRASDDWKAESEQLMSEVFPDLPWVLKDPRMCLLLESWDRLPEATRYVFVSRSPRDVARSLTKRDHMTPDHGDALWEIYNAAAETALQGKPVYAMTFEQLRAEPETHLRALAEFIGASEMAHLEQRISEAKALLDPRLGNAAATRGAAMTSTRWSHLESLTGAHPVFESSPPAQHAQAAEIVRRAQTDRTARRLKRLLRQGPVKVAAARLTRLRQKAQTIVWRNA